MSFGQLVPELALADPTSGASLLRQAFGFHPENGLMRCGSQLICLVQAKAEPTHGAIDHLALAVPDITTALSDMLANGASLDTDITPQGIAEIPEFWQAGIRYIYLRGPEGARIELCQNLANPATAIGHDHLGLPCTDIGATERFFETLGARRLSAVDLRRDDDEIPVRFLAFAGAVIELYSPPRHTLRPAFGHWNRLRVAGLAATITGPDGITLGPL